MSDTEKKDDVIEEKATEDEAKATEVKDGNKLVVEVDRSPEIETINKQLQEREAELKKLQEQFAETSKSLEGYMTQEKEKDEKYTNLETQFNDAKTKLQEIAHAEFVKVKNEKLEILKNSNVSEERIAEFDEKIKEPADLDQVDWMLATLTDSYVKAQEAEKERLAQEEKAKEEAAAAEAEKAKADAETTTATAQDLVDELKEEVKDDVSMPNTTPSNPPKHSVATTQPQDAPSKWEYSTAREAIDDLYDKIAEGGKEGEEAQSMIDRLWARLATDLKKNQNLGFSVSQCPICKGGIVEGEKCPYCDFDPALFRAKGGEMWVTKTAI